ncbi:MAG: translation initiation factor IF-2 [Rickettsiales bacterium]|jgi:translation initiation factor IF-2|nr:translation initiation factor IF-2 [Rickettsiales bacterium]
MTDSNDTMKKETLKVANPGRLQLTKTVESGKVKQNFTHGRSKTVTVEVRKTRTFAQGAAGMVEVKAGSGSAGAFDDESLRHLTPEERQSRLKALKIAEEQMKLATEQAKLKPVAEAPASVQPVIERDEDLADASGIVKPKKPIIPAKDSKKPAATNPAAVAPQPIKPIGKTYIGDEEVSSEKPAKGGKLKLKGTEDRWSSGKITVQNALSSLEDQRVRSLASMRRQREKAIKKAAGVQQSTEKVIREVVIPEAITVQELSNRMAERVVDVIKTLMKLGMMVTATQSIDADTAELVVGEFGHKFKRVTEGDVENVLKNDEEEDASLLIDRPPVVTIMGHVDHGKTSLLDALRKTNVVEGEAGGITQHIGAYQVEVASGQKVTFLDTPGHEAFTAMRARGAKITDIVVLVVAADDGIMEQTKEAISHAKAAGAPIVVAVNKIDKPGADSSRVKQELMQYELIPEEFGGETMVVEVSAKTGQNLDKLVETLLLQAEVLELKSNPNRVASGVVVEAKLDQGKGVVTTLLIQKGTLKSGDIVVAGPAYGRVRSIIDDKGQAIKEATPGMPAMILGLSQAPEAGDVFSVVENEKTARDIAEYRARRIREQAVVASARTIDNLFGAAAGTNAKELAVIIKGDVQGSVEAIAGSVAKYSCDEVAVKVLHSGVGAITESDVTLSKATGAMVIAFNVRAAPKAKEMAAKDKITIRYYSVIYDVVDDVKAALSGMLSPTKRENFLGYAEIREIFNISKAGKVAGCMVTDGVIKRGCKVRLLRDNVVIHEGTLKTLKRFKDEVKEVKGGMECGMAFDNYEDIRQGDQIECFEVEELARTV